MTYCPAVDHVVFGGVLFSSLKNKNCSQDHIGLRVCPVFNEPCRPSPGFEKQMKNHPHIVSIHEAFEDEFCHYIVFELAKAGDLLEALKLKPDGFSEQQCRFMIRQATKGLAKLHDRRVAMQDVSLENMLIFVYDLEGIRIKVCDPGQAVEFQRDPETGEE